MIISSYTIDELIENGFACVNVQCSLAVRTKLYNQCSRFVGRTDSRNRTHTLNNLVLSLPGCTA